MVLEERALHPNLRITRFNPRVHPRTPRSPGPERPIGKQRGMSESRYRILCALLIYIP